MLRMKKRYRLINFICLLAVYKKLIGTGRVLGTRILRYENGSGSFMGIINYINMILQLGSQS